MSNLIRYEHELDGCVSELQALCRLYVKKFQRKVRAIEGHRTIERQKKLYSQGRDWFPNGKATRIVTWIDGVNNIGKHNHNPSKALDFFPEDLIQLPNWGCEKQWREFVSNVQICADELHLRVRNLGESKGDWPHWEII